MKPDGKDKSSLEDEHLDDAYDALKAGDKSAFRAALKNAVEACVERAQADDYEQDKTDEKE